MTSARRLGVEAAKGDWLTFVDSDDELLNDALQIFANNIDSKQIDVIATDLNWEGFISGEEYVKKTLCGELYNRVWGNLYRRTILTYWILDIPRNIKVGEDQIMNIRIGLNMFQGCAKCIRDKVYVYRHNTESVLNTWKITLEYEELFINELLDTLGHRRSEFSKYSKINKTSF